MARANSQGRHFDRQTTDRIVVLLQETEMSIEDIALRMRCSRSAINGINHRYKVRAYEGRRNRWVVVRPDGGETGILLARADGDQQIDSVGRQFAGRVGMFLRVDDFDIAYQRMVAAGVQFVSSPRDEPYGRLAVFLDLEGNRWDLLGRDPRR